MSGEVLKRIIEAAVVEMNEGNEKEYIENALDVVWYESRLDLETRLIAAAGSDNLIRNLSWISRGLVEILIHSLLVSEERLRHVCGLVVMTDELYEDIIVSVYDEETISTELYRRLLRIVREESNIDVLEMNRRLREKRCPIINHVLTILYPEEV